jgi:hypothetical protein
VGQRGARFESREMRAGKAGQLLLFCTICCIMETEQASKIYCLLHARAALLQSLPFLYLSQACERTWCKTWAAAVMRAGARLWLASCLCV